MEKRDKEMPYEVIIQERNKVDLYGNVVYYIYFKIVPKEIERIPVRGYRKLAGIWNCETCNGKGWYRLFNYFKYKPTLCYFKKAGHDENGNTRYEISLFNATMNVTRYFNLWRMKPGKHAMITNECGALDIIKEKFDNINIVEYGSK